MKKIIFTENRKIDYTANAKVNSDIISILYRDGFVPKHLMRFFLPFRGTQRILSICWWLYSRFVLLSIAKNGVVVVQHPNACVIYERYAIGFFDRLARKAKLIVLVQDLDVPRFADDRAAEPGSEPVVKMAKIAHKTIVHNHVMRRWFERRGVPSDRLIELQTFDYLAESKLVQAQFSRQVTVAGNLAPHKAAYAAHLREIKDVQWKLFSPYFDEATMGGPNIAYAGVCKAEEFPGLLNAGFGLVWDGDSVEECAGNAGRYTLMVSPHKFALYLASGLPVIVSADAAIAKFVLEHDVGFVVKSLRDIPKRLAVLTEAQYSIWAKNSLSLAGRVRAGYFTRNAMEKALM